MDFSKTFDLTTKEGMDNIQMALMIAMPTIGLPIYVVRKIFGSAPSAEEQAKTALELIAEGKRNGAKKLDIEISGEAGGHFSCPIEGVEISMGAGSNGNVKVHVEYA